jgi:RNA polymerase sigma-70 factor (ECF subfamily)
MNEHQFKEQIIPLSRRLFGLCLKITGNSDESKDIVQDVFLKLWSTREDLNKIENIPGYVTTITRNRCLDKIRLRKPTMDADYAEAQINKALEEPDDDKQEKLALITQLIPHLNEVQQKIFTMRDIECMEYSEIASQMGLSEENVRVTLSRARKKLREMATNATKQRILNN